MIIKLTEWFEFHKVLKCYTHLDLWTSVSVKNGVYKYTINDKYTILRNQLLDIL